MQQIFFDPYLNKPTIIVFWEQLGKFEYSLSIRWGENCRKGKMEIVDLGSERRTSLQKQTNKQKTCWQIQKNMSKNLWWCDRWVVITLKFFFSHSLQCLHTFIVHVLFKIIGQCNIIFLLVLKTTTHLSTYYSRLAQAWYRPQSKLWYKNQEFPKVLADRTTLIFYLHKFTELKFNVIPSASTERWNGNIHLKHELWNCNRSHFLLFHVVSLKQVPNLWILSRVHCLQKIVFLFIIFFSGQENYNLSGFPVILAAGELRYKFCM